MRGAPWVGSGVACMTMAASDACGLSSKPLTAAEGVELLLLKIRELDQENLRLKERLQSLVRLEVAVRNCAQLDMVARELLTAMDGGFDESA